MKNIRNLILIISILLISCKEQVEKNYNGFSETRSGLSYKMHIAGDGPFKSKEFDLVKFIMTGDKKDSLLYHSAGGPVGDGTDSLTIRNIGSSDIYKAFSLMNEGDSFSFIFPDKTRYEVKLIELVTAEQRKKRQASATLFYKELQQDEQILLESYIQNKCAKADKCPENFYFESIRDGRGPRAYAGKTVIVNYTASLIDGTTFFSTYDINQPFEFVVGTPGQALPGLELGVKKMRAGGKARIIVPSQLAFGSEGSSSGMVGPFKTVIFEIELLKIN